MCKEKENIGIFIHKGIFNFKNSNFLKFQLKDNTFPVVKKHLP